jgi:hypothetical protein
MTREEFFMYLTIGLIVVAPLVARLYRWVMLKRTTQTLHDQFDSARNRESSVHPSSGQKG